MQLIIDGNLYKVARITGPAHNMLGLEFLQKGDIGQLTIIDLETEKPNKEILTEDSIKAIVISAIEEFNREFKVDLRVKSIQFVSSDTPIIDCYKELTREIAFNFINNMNSV